MIGFSEMWVFDVFVSVLIGVWCVVVKVVVMLIGMYDIEKLVNQCFVKLYVKLVLNMGVYWLLVVVLVGLLSMLFLNVLFVIFVLVNQIYVVLMLIYGWNFVLVLLKQYLRRSVGFYWYVWLSVLNFENWFLLVMLNFGGMLVMNLVVIWLVMK